MNSENRCDHDINTGISKYFCCKCSLYCNNSVTIISIILGIWNKTNKVWHSSRHMPNRNSYVYDTGIKTYKHRKTTKD